MRIWQRLSWVACGSERESFGRLTKHHPELTQEATPKTRGVRALARVSEDEEDIGLGLPKTAECVRSPVFTVTARGTSHSVSCYTFHF